MKGTARKFNIDYHSLRRHWINHVFVEVRASYIAGAGASKDQLEALVADESLTARRARPEAPRRALCDRARRRSLT